MRPLLMAAPCQLHAHTCPSSPALINRPGTAGGDIGLLLAALHGGRVGRLIGIGAMAGSNHTVLPDLPDVFDPASFANLTQTQQVGGLAMPLPCL